TVIAQQHKKQKIKPRTYVAHYTEENISVDGLAKETAWQKAPYSNEFIDIEGVKKPTYTTKVKILWQKEWVYFFAEIQEPQVWATLKKKDTIIFNNNDFEIFIDPDGDSHNYYELEFNALNTIWDLFLTKPYGEKNVVLNDWDANGIQSAVHVNGTLNNPKDTDKGWSIEIAIPLKVFKTSYFEKIDLDKKFWRINFSRVQWNFQLKDGKYQRKIEKNGKLAHENNWVWSPQGVIAMHQPETWGYVYFSSKETNKNETFTIPKDEHIKWYLYTLYHRFKNGKTTKKLIEKPTRILGKSVTPKLETHQSGFNIWVKSPFTEKRILIKEDGKIIIN
ncbi:MAG: carbohydrate-binding family 9-like protein, partial [Polaribacter sp.]